jgi:hypothetical protein
MVITFLLVTIIILTIIVFIIPRFNNVGCIKKIILKCKKRVSWKDPLTEHKIIPNRFENN